MAWLFGDSFDGYTDLSTKYQIADSAGVAVVAGQGRFGTAACRVSVGQKYLGKGVTPGSATSYVGVAVRAATLNFSDGFLAIGDAINTRTHVLYQLNDDGSISAFRMTTNSGWVQNYGGVLLGSTPAGVIHPGVYHRLEFGTTIHASAGFVEIRIDGIVRLTLTGLNTVNPTASGATYSLVVFGMDSSTTSFDLDDLWICDSTGARCNSFLGDLTGEVILPSTDGATIQWTRSGGSSNASCVDETPPDGDTTTVSSSTVGHKDRYAHPALSRIGGGIQNVQVLTVGKKSDAGTRLIAHVVRSGGTDYVGTDHAPTTAYTQQITPFEVDPATSGAWSVAAVNATEIGQQVTG